MLNLSYCVKVSAVYQYNGTVYENETVNENDTFESQIL